MNAKDHTNTHVRACTQTHNIVGSCDHSNDALGSIKGG